MVATVWALLPAVIAIALALCTKEVYTSLLIGILTGALFFNNFSVIDAAQTTFEIMGTKIGSNANILIFLVFLGILVSLVSKSGASDAYGNWASRSIKTKRGALLATTALGALIFVDDYFNCLTVGTVMRPVTDKHKISRAKLAYIIDATAAPVCIIAPISSWAAAVGSSLPDGSNIDGFSLFIKTIPFNLYAILTVIMMLFLVITNSDFFAMKKYEQAHQNEVSTITTEQPLSTRGTVFDLIFPIGLLIALCIAAMLYTGGILEGASVSAAFADCDASLALVLGSFATLFIMFFLYIPRKILSFKQFTDSFVDGFKAMTPALIILSLAWTLSGVCSADYMDAGGFVRDVVGGSTMINTLLPLIFFVVATGLAFATGTSWGTFGILIPIIIAVLGDVDSSLLVISVAAILAGAVCGDHISPISDTTILASTGAQCNHIDHVSTQIPYALVVASASALGYLVGGFTVNGWLGLLVGVVTLIIALVFIYKKSLTE